METSSVADRRALILCTDDSALAAARLAELLLAQRMEALVVRAPSESPAADNAVVFADVRHPLVTDAGAAPLRTLGGGVPAAVVAFGPPEAEEQAFSRGFEAYLAEPFGDAAAHLLEVLVRGARSADRLATLEREVQSLAGRAERLTAEVRERAEFLQNLTHELATPLTPLMGYLKLLRSGRLGPLTDKQQQALDAMANAADRLEHSLDNLVDYASLQTGHDRVQVADIDGAALVDECVKELHQKARAKHVLLDARHPQAAPLKGDPRKLRQALVNVIDNALRFSPHGGHVLVELVDEPARVLFAVFDQGPGLEADAQNPAAWTKRDEKAPGASGLGLPVTRQIVEAHRGTLVLESPPREQPDARELFTGSKVGFWIPKGA